MTTTTLPAITGPITLINAACVGLGLLGTAAINLTVADTQSLLSITKHVVGGTDHLARGYETGCKKTVDSFLKDMDNDNIEAQAEITKD